MGFFDLNIPYHESERNISDTTRTSFKKTRQKLVTKAISLGYSSASYNHTIKGVMSESDRCSIPLFSPSTILKQSPSLLSSVKFHRQLLDVPIASPFRQYTRLTVIIDSPSQASPLNTANPILKTYDLVAVRPLNQITFQQACQTAQVDIISIDFSDKLQFRLNQSMVQAAVKRGVYFEITYSCLIFDAQARMQMISNAKLLVDWTRGKNLIISSGAPSVTELRGPNDVANLSSLFGLTMEKSKAAISKNCRFVIANALRKKHFFKEAIKVEKLPPGGEINFDDWLNWDPITSGEGDLTLDDMGKSFSASYNVSKAAKAIDFASAVNGIPSHGLQIKDMISTKEAAVEPFAMSEDLTRKLVCKTSDNSVAILDEPHVVDLCNHRKSENVSSVAHGETMEQKTISSQMQTDGNARTNNKLPDNSPLGRSGVKRKTSQRISLSPFKRLISARPLRKKARK